MKEFINTLEKEAGLASSLGAALFKISPRLHRLGRTTKALSPTKGTLGLMGLTGAATTIGPLAGREAVTRQQQALYGQLPKQPKSMFSDIYRMDAGPVGLLKLPIDLIRGG